MLFIIALLGLLASATAVQDCTPQQVANSDLIVETHNKFRNQVAGGEVSVYNNELLPKASNMIRMQYDDDLASTAQAHASLCVMEHSYPYSAKYPKYGQNLYQTCSSAPITEFNWNKAIASWTNEAKDFPAGSRSPYAPGSEDGKMVGHFTQVIWGSSYKIGCGVSTYSSNADPGYPYCALFTCDYYEQGNVYSTDNTLLFKEIYTSTEGDPCESCTCDQTYQNLCVPQ